MFENEERYQLAEERIREIAEEARESVADFAADYFVREAGELTLFLDEYNFLQKEAADAPLNVWQKHNHVLYEDILPENYGHSYVNPEYAVSKLGKEYGQLLSMLAYELRSLIGGPDPHAGAAGRSGISDCHGQRSFGSSLSVPVWRIYHGKRAGNCKISADVAG